MRKPNVGAEVLRTSRRGGDDVVSVLRLNGPGLPGSLGYRLGRYWVSECIRAYHSEVSAGGGGYFGCSLRINAFVGGWMR